MFGVGKVGVAAGGGVEGHDEAVGEAVIEAFGAFVGAVFHVEEAGDLADHAFHLGEAIVDLGGGDAVFELEHAEVSDHEGRIPGDGRGSYSERISPIHMRVWSSGC